MTFKNRPIEFGALLLIAAGVLIYFALVPLVNKLHQVNLESAVKNQELSKKEEKLEGLNQINSRLPELKNDLVVMTNALPKDEDIPGLLVIVEGLAGASGLGVSGLTPASETKTEGAATETAEETTEEVGIGTVAVTLTLSGPYPAFLSFLENLEVNLRPLSLTTINIAGGGTPNPLSINLNLSAYFQK